jgi:putative ABC transport system ATP-binding protein
MDDNAIDLQHIEFTWPGNTAPALKIDSLSLERGGRLFVAGPSGSGKSTLLALIGGIILPCAGEISVLGTSLKTMSSSMRDRFRVNHIGFIFQQFNLIPYLSVLDNVLLPCRFSLIRRQGALEQGRSMEEAAKSLLLELGLDELLWHRSANSLSVGQQQRAAAARALIGKPAIIVADEPTSALDAAHQEDFIGLLMNECVRFSTALIFVSHDERLSKHFQNRLTLTEPAKDLV